MHAISESDFDFGEDESNYGRFQNSDAFLLQRFGGYESDDSEDPDDDKEEEEGLNKGTFLSFIIVIRDA